MQAALVGQLGVEGDGQHVALAHRDGMPVDLGQHLHPVAGVLDPGRADEDRVQRLALAVEVRLEAEPTWRPNALRRDGHVEQAEVLAVEHDQAGAGAEHRAAGAHELAQRLGQRLALDPERHRGALAAGDHEPVEPVEVVRARAPRGPRAELLERPGVCLEAALEGEHPDSAVRATSRDAGAGRRWPRGCRSRARASPRPARARPRQRAPAPRSASWPRRSPARGARGRRT